MSEEFEIAFIGTCGLVRECKCGRTHFNTVDVGYYATGELDELMSASHKTPDKYIPHDEGDVSTVDVLGSEFVSDCPCGGVDRAEKAIWNSRYAIMDYFKKRMQKEENELKDLKDAMEGINNE